MNKIKIYYPDKIEYRYTLKKWFSTRGLSDLFEGKCNYSVLVHARVRERSVMVGSFYWTVSWYIWKHAFYFMLDLARASFFNYDA